MIVFFFFNDTATTEIYTLSLHDALPIWARRPRSERGHLLPRPRRQRHRGLPRPPRGGMAPHARGRAADVERPARDRKSTRLNSSHANISYAVFCLKKKNIILNIQHLPAL